MIAATRHAALIALVFITVSTHTRPTQGKPPPTNATARNRPPPPNSETA